MRRLGAFTSERSEVTWIAQQDMESHPLRHQFLKIFVSSSQPNFFSIHSTITLYHFVPVKGEYPYAQF